MSSTSSCCGQHRQPERQMALEEGRPGLVELMCIAAQRQVDRLGRPETVPPCGTFPVRSGSALAALSSRYWIAGCRSIAHHQAGLWRKQRDVGRRADVDHVADAQWAAPPCSGTDTAQRRRRPWAHSPELTLSAASNCRTTGIHEDSIGGRIDLALEQFLGGYLWRERKELRVALVDDPDARKEFE